MYKAPLPVIKFLIEKAGYKPRILAEPITYLYQAARHEEPDLEILDYLIKDLGLNAGTKYGNGVTVLHELVSMRKGAASAGLQILVQNYGADPHQENEQHVSAIALARSLGVAKLGRSLEVWAPRSTAEVAAQLAKHGGPTTTASTLERIYRQSQDAPPTRPSAPGSRWL